jgi:hypothetical protein
MTRYFYIHEKHYGTSPALGPCEHSYLWYCSTCGLVYARLWVDGQRRWHGFEGCCEQCQPAKSVWWQIPGSIWCEYDWQYNCRLPREVVLRELELAIEYYEKGEMQWQMRKKAVYQE